jgi:hypothetical protein
VLPHVADEKNLVPPQKVAAVYDRRGFRFSALTERRYRRAATIVGRVTLRGAAYSDALPLGKGRRIYNNAPATESVSNFPARVRAKRFAWRASNPLLINSSA